MSLKDVLEGVREAPIPPNEEAAKFQIIAPILKCLGWDPFSGTEVLPEHRVETTEGSGRVDFALQHKGHIFAHIEAKAPGHDLDKYVKQAVGYGFNEGVDVCALTSGFDWQLYLPRADRPPEERLFASLRLQHDPVDQMAEDLETFLGKANLVSRRSERRAQEVLKARRQTDRLKSRLPSIWARMVQGPSEKLVELVIEQAYEELNLRPTAEQAQAVLHGSPVPSGPTPPAAPRQRPPEPQDPPAERHSLKTASEIVPYDKIVAYKLWDKRQEASTWNAMLVGVAEALYQRHRHDFDRILTLRGRKYPFASRRKEEISANPKAVGTSGIYINTHGSASTVSLRAARFLKLFDHPEDELRIETRTH